MHSTYVGMLERCEKHVTTYNIERIVLALAVERESLLTSPASL